MEVSELHKSKRQLLELVEQKDTEISEKNVTIQSYLEKIVSTPDHLQFFLRVFKFSKGNLLTHYFNAFCISSYLST